jgi:hypothetical protein
MTAAETEIKNQATLDEKKIISRLILQRILASDVSQFLAEDSLRTVNDAFLSEEPDRDISLKFKLLKSKSDYYSMIMDAHLKWELGKNELVDLEGNVWVTYTLKIGTSISSSFNGSLESFLERATCIAGGSDLLSEIAAMVPNSIRVKTLTNDQRIDRDNRVRHEKSCYTFENMFELEHKTLRKGLRCGGRNRGVLRNLVEGHEPGKYELVINDGSRRRPKLKKYLLTIPVNPEFSALLRRIA